MGTPCFFRAGRRPADYVRRRPRDLALRQVETAVDTNLPDLLSAPIISLRARARFSTDKPMTLFAKSGISTTVRAPKRRLFPYKTRRERGIYKPRSVERPP